MRLHLIPNSHIDPVWLWDKYEGIDEVVNTFRSACDRLDEHPALTFTASSLAFYEWVLQCDPGLFKRIQANVAADRWEVAGGWWIEADSNMPTAESFRKQADLSQAFSQKHFGRKIEVAYLPDSFGHPATLPALLADTGFKYFLFCRPGWWENPNLPGNLFYWEHAGKKVLAYRLKHHYLQYGAPAPAKVDANYLLPKLNDPEYAQFPANCYLFGVGDHGGGPCRAEIEFYNEYLRTRPPGDAGYSSCLKFFREIAAMPGIPTYRGDLHMHAVGCYSVMRGLKHAIREAEHGLVFTERAAGLSGGPAPDLTDAWKTTLFNQFHDIMPGSAAPHAVTCSIAEMGGVAKVWRDASYASLKAISRRSKVRRAEGEFRIFNTLPFDVTGPLGLESFMYFKPGAAFRDQNNALVEIQEVLPSVRCGNRRWEFVDTLPAGGFKSYGFDSETVVPLPGPEAGHFHPGDHIAADRAEIRGDGTCLLREPEGELRPLLERSVRFLVLADASDTWGHGVRSYDEIEGAFALQSSAILAGPVTAKLYQHFTYGRSTLEVIYSIYTGLPRIYAEIVVNWNETRKILKLEIAPADSRFTTFTMQAPGGAIERRADGGELPLHNWVLLPGWRGPVGVIQDGAFGCDCETGRLRLTLVRSSLYGYDASVKLPPADPQRHTDLGEHRFRLCLMRQAGLDAPALDRETQAFLEPFMVIRESGG